MTGIGEHAFTLEVYDGIDAELTKHIALRAVTSEDAGIRDAGREYLSAEG